METPKGKKILLRALLVTGVFLTILPYFIYSTIPENIGHKELVIRAIAGCISSITGGLCIAVYIWKR